MNLDVARAQRCRHLQSDEACADHHGAARALCRLGVPSRDDIQQLFQQIDLLSQNIQELTQAAEMEPKVKKIRAVRSVESVAASTTTEPAA